MTKDNGMDVSPSWQELKAELDDAQRQAGYWKTLAERMARDKQALKAHLDDWRWAYEQFGADYPNAEMLELVNDQGPTTSLAHRDARVAAEALEDASVEADRIKIGDAETVLWLKERAETILRQASGDDS